MFQNQVLSQAFGFKKDMCVSGLGYKGELCIRTNSIFVRSELQGNISYVMNAYSCAFNLDEKEVLIGKSLGRNPLEILKIN